MTARTVLVLHREQLVARAIAAALGQHPGIAAVAGVELSQASRRRVDAAVLDARLPGADGVADALEASGTRVVMIGGAARGARPAVDPDGSIEELVTALVPVRRLRAVPITELSPREREIATLVAQGLAAKQVASLLGISPKTVERHKTHIFAKLGVPNQAAAAAVVSRTHREVAWTS